MTRWSNRQILGAAVAAWLIVGILALLSGPPLGHDEAAYAIAARGAAPLAYRSTGMVAIARIGLALGGSNLALRLVPLGFGAVMILAAYALGRAAFDARTGAWAAAVLATAHPMASRSVELIGDLPATALVLAGLAILIGELERDRARWRIVWAAPLFAGAFYIRYGSAPVLATIGLLVIALYAKKLALPVLALLVVFAACIAPHFIHSVASTGSPLGILSASAAMPRRAYIGEGLVTYLTSDPFVFYGAITAPVMLAGVLGLVLSRVHRPQLFLALLAFVQLVALGIESHAQPRYVFLATALLVIAGVDTLREYGSERVAVATTSLAWALLAILIVPFQHSLARARTPIYSAAATIREDLHGRSCAVAANVVPQLVWATGCDVIVAHSLPHLREPWPRVEAKYIVSVPYAAVPKSQFDAVVAKAGGAPHALVVASPDAHVWRID